jgi:hypothetical protein
MRPSLPDIVVHPHDRVMVLDSQAATTEAGVEARLPTRIGR